MDKLTMKLDDFTLKQLYQMRDINQRLGLDLLGNAQLIARIDDLFLIEINKRLNQPGPITQSLT